MKRSSQFGKCNTKVNRKSIRRKANSLMAYCILLLMIGVSAIECIPLGAFFILAGLVCGYFANEIEKGLDS